MIARTTHRGVTYTARVTPDGTVELAANGRVIEQARLELRIWNRQPLGGDDESDQAITAELEAGLRRALVG